MAEAFLYSISKVKTLPKGEVLIRQGEFVKKTFFVTAGCLRSYCINKIGKEHTLQFAIKDWWISDYIAIHADELAIFTEQKNLEMKNGKFFSTGNHPVEAFLPMLHLRNAGFEFEIATPTGKPVVFEMWAYPSEDEEVKAIYEEHKSSFEKPMKLSDFIDTSFTKTESYAAVFVPGGHGAMIGIPEDVNVSKILNWAHENDLFTISLCHGPGSFLSTTLNNQKFIYEGYNMAVFPDSVDKKTPMVGYLPGQMPYGLSEKLKSLGANLMNTKMDKTVCVDRKLITGSSPLASNELGILAANTLLKELK